MTSVQNPTRPDIFIDAKASRVGRGPQPPRPWTEQPQGCGQPGLAIHLPSPFVDLGSSDNKVYQDSWELRTKGEFSPNNDQKFMCWNECLVGHAAAKSFCIANKAPFTLIVEVPFQTGYCLVLYVCFAYIAGGGSHESKWFF